MGVSKCTRLPFGLTEAPAIFRFNHTTHNPEWIEWSLSPYFCLTVLLTLNLRTGAKFGSGVVHYNQR